MKFIIVPSGNGVVQLLLNESTSSFYYYGIVQIWYNGEWGNICDDDEYDQYEADVICHQLGYTGASSYSRAGNMRFKDLTSYFLLSLLLVMEQIIMKLQLMKSIVLTIVISLSYNVPTLQPLIVDVLIVMMLLCTAVSINIFLSVIRVCFRYH